MAAEPTVETDLFKVESTGIERIPDDQRHGHPWELGAMWAGAFLNYASLLTGSLLLGFGLGVWDSLSALVVGATLAGLILGLVSISGPWGGVPQIVFSRRVFGYQGAYLAGALTVFLAIGWFAVDCVIATDALTQLGRELGIPGSRGASALVLLVVVAISVVVAVYGHRTVVVFERYGAVVFLAFAVILLVDLLPKMHPSAGATVHGAAHLGAWLLGAGIAFALVASWFSFAADYSRYLPKHSSPRAIAASVTVGSSVPVVALGLLGILLLSIKAGSTDVLATIVASTPKPLAIAFLLFVALGMIWANYLDVYTAGLAALALDVRLERWKTAALCGAVGGVLASYALFAGNFLVTYQNFLLVTYIWAPAWAAVVLLDLLGSRTERIESTTFSQNSRVRWPALVSLVAGTVAAIPFVNSTLWQSPIAVHALYGADISGFVSFAVGGAIFAVLRPASPRASAKLHD